MQCNTTFTPFDESHPNDEHDVAGAAKTFSLRTLTSATSATIVQQPSPSCKKPMWFSNDPAMP